MRGRSARTLIRALLPMSVVLGFAGPAASAAEPVNVPRAFILFDGSGSMWGKLAGQFASKLAIAQAAFEKHLPPIGQSGHVGLIMFGGRSSGSCEQVSVVAQPSAQGGRQIAAAARRFNPQGRGPLALAMQRAGEALRATAGGPASLILIHDGPDNCNQDPCAVAKALKAANGNLPVHVLSLGVTPQISSRVACISRITGGQQFNITDGPGFDDALQKVLKLALARPGRSPSPAPRVQKRRLERPDNGKPGLRLSAHLKAGGPAVLKGLRWRVVPASKGGRTEKQGSALYDGRESDPLLDLAPGTYDVLVALGQVRTKGTFTVGDKGKTAAKLTLNAGSVSVRTLTSRGGVQIGDILYTLSGPAKDGQQAGKTIAAVRADATDFHLKPGPYVISARRGGVKVSQPVSVLAGSVAQLDLVLNMGELALSAVAAKGAAAETDVFFFVFDERVSDDGIPRQVAQSASPKPIFSLPVGTYRVLARSGNIETSQRISVLAGRRTTHEVNLGSANLQLTSRLLGSDMSLDGLITYRVVRLGANQREIARTVRSNPTLRLAAGSYRIEGRFGGANAVESLTVTMREGADQRLSMEHQAGIVRLRLTAIRNGLALADVFWDIMTEGGQTVWSSGEAEPEVPLRAGRYKVVVERRGKRWDRVVEVISGKRQTFELLTR